MGQGPVLAGSLLPLLLALFVPCPRQGAEEPVTGLDLAWYEFEPTRGSGGLRPLYAPWRYECRSGNPDENQAYTFPHLLSFKFDFVPDNNSYYHPFFVFKRSRWTTLQLTAELERSRLAEFAERWGGSHVFHGLLIEDDERFGGEFRVSSPDGSPLYEREYAVEFGYFELMGRIVGDWMDERGQSLSPGLAEELGRPMCADLEAVRVLGRAALAEERSEVEWDVYERVLELAPEFAETRFWYGNQRQWSDGDAEQGQLRKGRALASHPVLRAIVEFRPDDCPDPELVETFRESLRRAREISPEDPRLIRKELREGNANNMTLRELDVFLPVVQSWPGVLILHDELDARYRFRNALEKSMPLALSGLRSGAVPAAGGPADSWAELAIGFALMGDIERAQRLAQVGVREDGSSYASALVLAVAGMCARELGDSRTAVDALGLAWEELEDEHSLSAVQCLAALEARTFGFDPLERAMGLDSRWRAIIRARARLADDDPRGATELLELQELGRHQMPRGNTTGTHLVDHRLEAALILAEAAFELGDLDGARTASHHALLLAPYSKRARTLWEWSRADDVEARHALGQVMEFVQRKHRRYRERRGRPSEEELRTARRKSEALRTAAAALQGDARRAFWWGQPVGSVAHTALVLTRGGKLEEALELWLDHADAAQEISNAQEIHGRVFVRKLLLSADPELRRSWLAKLAELPSGPVWHYAEMGKPPYEEERFAEALPFYEKAARTSRNSKNWYEFQVGYCRKNLGDFEGALECFRLFLQGHPTNPVGLYQLGAVLRQLGRGEEAFDALLDSVQRDARDFAVSELRGLVLELVRTGAQPAQELERLLAVEEAGAADDVVLRAIAERLERLGRTDEAEEVRLRIGALDGESR